MADKAWLWKPHGLNLKSVVTERDDAYYTFAPHLKERSSIKQAVIDDAGVTEKEHALQQAFANWWTDAQEQLRHLPSNGDVMEVRSAFLDSFENKLRPVGLLNRYRVAGVIAQWWAEQETDIKSLAAQGSMGLVDSWVTSIEDAAARSDKNATDPIEHKLVQHLLTDYLQELDSAATRISELQGAKDAFETGENAAEDDWQDEDVDRYDKYLKEHVKELKGLQKEVPDRAADLEVKIKDAKRELARYDRIKKDLRAAKKEEKALRNELLPRLQKAHTALTEAEAETLVLAIARAELQAELQSYVEAQRQRVVALFENWWDKYRVTMRDIKSDREATTQQLNEYLEVMGYV